MSQTAARLLGLLSLLMVPRSWSGTELAERLDVSSRTVRNDIGTLRDLGYPVEGTRGGEGGYRMGSGGAAVPPLLLNPDEAVAVAVGLHSGLSCIIGGMEEVSAQALAKLEQILPSGIRNRVKNLAHFTVPLASYHPMPIVDPNLLTQIIEHCQSHQRLRFVYRSSSAETSGGEKDADMEIEPYRLVNHQHRWYLLGFDTGPDDWVILQVERIAPKLPGGRRFEPRTLPDEDIGTYVERNVTTSRWRHSAKVVIDAPATEVMAMLMPAEGTVEALDDTRSTATIGAETLSTMTLTLARLDVDFTVVDSAELTAELSALAERLRRASTPQG